MDDQDAIIDQLRPYFEVLTESVLGGFDDFTTVLPEAFRLSLPNVRPGFTHGRAMARLEEKYGCDKEQPVRVQQVDRMKVFVVAGQRFNVGVRIKKLDRHYLSANRRSNIQDDCRRTCSIPGMEENTRHVIFGYRCRRSLEPSIVDINLTSEVIGLKGYVLDWRHPVWDAEGGAEPAFTVPQPLFPQQPGQQPGFRISPKTGGAGRRADGLG